jgi:hypothetical protein
MGNSGHESGVIEAKLFIQLDVPDLTFIPHPTAELSLFLGKASSNSWNFYIAMVGDSKDSLMDKGFTFSPLTRKFCAQSINDRTG